MQRRTLAKTGTAVALLLALVTGCSGTRAPSTEAGPGSAGSASTAAPATTAAQSFGTLPSPCGPGDAKGATDQGVSNSSIRIGYGDDRGFAQSPGLNRAIGDAVKGMIKWCNAQGGINGRTIDGDFYDAAITQVTPVMQQACATDFMLVGEGWSGDEAAEQTRVGCRLPAVPAFTVGSDFANGPMMYQALPNPDDYQPASIFYQLAKQFPQDKDAFAFLNTTLPATTATIAKLVPTVQAAGFTVKDCGVTISYTGEPSYVAFALKFKACGAKVVYLSLNPGPVTYDLITAMNQVGVHPIYVMQANGYTPGFAQWNTAGLANNVYVMSSIEPLENAATVPAVQQYLNIVNSVNGTTGVLGMQAASSFLLWAEAAKSCGSTLTRQCLVDELAATHDWTAGGLNAPTDPGDNRLGTCGLELKLDGTKWTQAFPAQAGAFDCNSEYAFKTPASTWGTRLNANRIATTFLSANVIEPQS